MVSIREAQETISQRKQEVAQAKEQVSSFDPSIERTQQMLRTFDQRSARDSPLLRREQLSESERIREQQKQKVLQQVLEAEEQVKEYEKQVGSFLGTEGGKLAYVKEFGIKPVKYETMGAGLKDDKFTVEIPVYDTPYGQVKDLTPYYEAQEDLYKLEYESNLSQAIADVKSATGKSFSSVKEFIDYVDKMDKGALDVNINQSGVLSMPERILQSQVAKKDVKDILTGSIVSPFEVRQTKTKPTVFKPENLSMLNISNMPSSPTGYLASTEFKPGPSITSQIVGLKTGVTSAVEKKTTEIASAFGVPTKVRTELLKEVSPSFSRGTIQTQEGPILEAFRKSQVSTSVDPFRISSQPTPTEIRLQQSLPKETLLKEATSKEFAAIESLYPGYKVTRTTVVSPEKVGKIVGGAAGLGLYAVPYVGTTILGAEAVEGFKKAAAIELPTFSEVIEENKPTDISESEYKAWLNTQEGKIYQEQVKQYIGSLKFQKRGGYVASGLLAAGAVAPIVSRAVNFYKPSKTLTFSTPTKKENLGFIFLGQDKSTALGVSYIQTGTVTARVSPYQILKSRVRGEPLSIPSISYLPYKPSPQFNFLTLGPVYPKKGSPLWKSMTRDSIVIPESRVIIRPKSTVSFSMAEISGDKLTGGAIRYVSTRKGLTYTPYRSLTIPDNLNRVSTFVSGKTPPYLYNPNVIKEQRMIIQSIPLAKTRTGQDLFIFTSPRAKYDLYAIKSFPRVPVTSDAAYMKSIVGRKALSINNIPAPRGRVSLSEVDTLIIKVPPKVKGDVISNMVVQQRGGKKTPFSTTFQEQQQIETLKQTFVPEKVPRVSAPKILIESTEKSPLINIPRMTGGIKDITSQYIGKGTYEQTFATGAPTVNMRVEQPAKLDAVSSPVRGTSKAFSALSPKFSPASRKDLTQPLVSIPIIKSKIDLGIKENIRFGSKSRSAQTPALAKPKLKVDRIVIPVQPTPPDKIEPIEEIGEFNLDLPKPRKSKKTEEAILGGGDELFVPYVRRKGKFVRVGKARPFAAALKRGKGIVKQTLAASLQLRGARTGKAVPLKIPGKEFRFGKSEGVTTLVQRRESRLSTIGERRAITKTRRNNFKW